MKNYIKLETMSIKMTITNTPIRPNRKPMPRRIRNSISLGNLDIIEEWPETIKIHVLDLDELNEIEKPKKSFFWRKMKKLKKLRKLLRNRSEGVKHLVELKKTPILAQKEIIVCHGVTIWEEELTGNASGFF